MIQENDAATSLEAVMQDRDLPLKAKGIYAYLYASFVFNEPFILPLDGVCFDLNISTTLFNKYKKVLISKGYLKIEEKRENGKFTQSFYTLL